LEKNLLDTLHTYENDVTASTEDIVFWRKDQKLFLEMRKQTLKQLRQALKALEEEEMNRRRVLEEEELTRRRDLEDQERDREIQWIQMRNAAHQNLPKSGKSIDDDIRSSNGDSSPNYGSQFSCDPDIIQRQDSNLQASNKVCMNPPKASLKTAEVEIKSARHTSHPSAESHEKDHAPQFPGSQMQ